MAVSVTGISAVMKMLEKAVRDEIRELTSTLQEEIKQRTPIDTGRARRGWRKRTQGGVSNRVPYIGALEQGRSRQAPSGFVKQSVTATINRRKTR
jgi:hypothetical protein